MTDLTRGSEGKAILAFAVPMLLGNVFQQLYSTVDGIVVGQFVGKEALAAVGASFPIMFLMIAFVMGITMGASIMISQFFGAGDTAKLARTRDTAMIFLLAASVLVSVAGIAASGLILRLVQVPEAVFPLARDFLRIIFAGMVFMFGYNAVSAIFRGIGDSRRPLYFLVIATMVNVALELLFVAGFHWGVAGAAWATVISQAISFGLGVAYMQRTPLLRLNLRVLVFDWALFRTMLRIGLPAGAQQTFVSLGFIALNRIVNPFGTAVIAGFTAAQRLDSFAMLPAMNLSMAVSTFVGQNLGADKPERVRRGYISALLIGIGISAALTVVMIFCNRPLVALFNIDPSVVAIGAEYLVIVSLFYPAFVVMSITGGVMRGAGDTIVQLGIGIIDLWAVRIPVSGLLSARLGTAGIWWGIPAGWCVAAAVSVAYYLTGRWKRKRLAGARPGRLRI
jgi:putative MATE family efflux protein